MDDGSLPCVYIRCPVAGCGIVLRSAMKLRPVQWLGLCSAPVRCPVHGIGYGEHYLCWKNEDPTLHEIGFLQGQARLEREYHATNPRPAAPV